jgi:aryl sulfotransferase
VASERWQRFAFRPDDIVISTPAKCGTTWMQTIIGMLVFDRIDLGAPISTISPWLDMLTYTDEETFRLLEEQRHRRFIKTHTPLDGVPRLPSVNYIAVIRHPLDVALSYRDHDENLDSERLVELRTTAAGPDDTEDGSLGDALNVRKSERHPEDEPGALKSLEGHPRRQLTYAAVDDTPTPTPLSFIWSAGWSQTSDW